MILAVDPSKFIGLSLDDARNQIMGYGYSSRVTKVDGRALIVTRDYDPLRLNLSIENNRVVNVTVG